MAMSKAIAAPAQGPVGVPVIVTPSVPILGFDTVIVAPLIQLYAKIVCQFVK